MKWPGRKPQKESQQHCRKVNLVTKLSDPLGCGNRSFLALGCLGRRVIPDVSPEAEALGLKYSAGIWLTHDEEAYEILG